MVIGRNEEGRAMGLLDNLSERNYQREREKAERREASEAAEKAAREAFRQNILQSQLFADVYVSLEAAVNQPDSS